MQAKKNYKIRRYQKGIYEEKIDDVIVEYRLRLSVNGKKFVSLLCTPKSLRELVVGFLYSEGIIESYEAVESIKIDEDQGIAEVCLSNKDSYKMINELLCAERTITTGCGKEHTITYPLILDQPRMKPIESIDEERLLEISQQFNKASELFKTTGGVHSCGLYDGDVLVKVEEDIGRHNAMDKIVGYSLMEKVYLGNKVIFTSGRISSEIMTKLIRSQVSIVVSRSAPTDIAIEMAKNQGITLICFARGSRMNLYT